LTGKQTKILIYGYGNPGRQDDGLGIELVEEIDRWCTENGLDHVYTDSNYQLNLEDASEISGYDVVIFADASREEIRDFCLDPLTPSDKTEFSMHAVSPAFILHLSESVFHHEPEAYLLHIRGYEWEFMAGMTEKARTNLAGAVEYIKDFVKKHSS
jgi:hydrogenase maturation protease